MNSQPFIGLSGSVNSEQTQHFILRDYMKAILEAGGVPLLLSPDLDAQALEGCLERLDGLLLAGGNDVDPSVYGQPPMPGLGEVNPLRDAFEGALVRAALRRRMPLLGICRGVQAMNAALGGTLYQDLPSQRPEGWLHAQTAPGSYPSHEVTVRQGTLLARVVGEGTLRVNSFHHQAVRDAAPCLRVAAQAGDGVVEALEHPDLPFFLGVQWHPERMYATDARAAALFEGLCRAARGQA